MFWNPTHSNMASACALYMYVTVLLTNCVYLVHLTTASTGLIGSFPPFTSDLHWLPNFSRPKSPCFIGYLCMNFCVFAWNSNNFVETIVTIFEITNVRLKLWQMWSYFQTTQISSEFVSPIIGLQFDGSFSARLVHLSGRL